MSQGDTTIIARYLLRQIGIEPCLLQSRERQFRQQFVLEHAAAQSHCIKWLLRVQSLCLQHNTVRQTAMELHRARGERHVVVLQRGEQRLPVDDQRTLREYLDSITADERLKAVLSANNTLYGVPPAECPCFLHFLVLDSFVQSAWKVNGGSGELTNSFIKTLKAVK